MPTFLYKAAPFIIGAVFVVVLARAAWNFWFSGGSRRWPSVHGKVRLARIVRGYRRDEDKLREEYFDVEVEHEYRVRGKEYVGTRYSFGEGRYSRYDDAMEALRGIAAGAKHRSITTRRGRNGRF